MYLKDRSGVFEKSIPFFKVFIFFNKITPFPVPYTKEQTTVKLSVRDIGFPGNENARTVDLESV